MNPSEGPSNSLEEFSLTNGGLLYHEIEESKLCALHCLNTLLQGPFFSVKDLSNIASNLALIEGQVIADYDPRRFTGDFLVQDSHNVFTIQVIEKALKVWDLRAIPLNSSEAPLNQHEYLENESAFICHLFDHWFCIRKVNGEWYDFNSLYAVPTPLSRFYLAAFIDTLKSRGWIVYLVRGNLPTGDCPVTKPNSFGQWLTPEDAKKLSDEIHGTGTAPPSSTLLCDGGKAEEDIDLDAAMAASLNDYPTITSVKTYGVTAAVAFDAYAADDDDAAYDATSADDDDEGGVLAGSPAVVSQSLHS